MAGAWCEHSSQGTSMLVQGVIRSRSPFGRAALVLLGVIVGASNSAVRASDCELSEPAFDVLLAHPGVQVYVDPNYPPTPNNECRAVAFWGGVLAESNTSPADAAQQWFSQHPDAFLPGLELELLETIEIVNPATGRTLMTVFQYRQMIASSPAETGGGGGDRPDGSPRIAGSGDLQPGAASGDQPDGGGSTAALVMIPASGSGRVLVMHGGVAGPPYLVTFASAPNLASVPPGGFAPDTINAGAALVIAQSAAPDLDQWTTAELIIFRPTGEVDAVRSWRVGGSSSTDLAARTYFINAADGTIVHVRDDVYHFGEVTGTVRGKIPIPPYPLPSGGGTWPDCLDPGDPNYHEPCMIEVPIANAYVQRGDPCAVLCCDDESPLCEEPLCENCPEPSCGDRYCADPCKDPCESGTCDQIHTVTDSAGEFRLDVLTGEPVCVSLGHCCGNPEDGPWVNIASGIIPSPCDGKCVEVCLNTLRECKWTFVPGSISFLFPDEPVESRLAQLAAWDAAERTIRAFAASLGSGRELLFSSAECVNTTPPRGIWLFTNKPGDACAATTGGGFTCPRGIGLGPASALSGCVNAAYATIVAHEFAHFLIGRFIGENPSGQGTFGEGYGDAWAALVYDVDRIGEYWMGPGTFVRSVLAAAEPGGPCTERVQLGCTEPDTDILCDGETLVPSAYYCGKLLSGIWYDLRWQLENYDWGPGTQAESALDYARRLFVSWTMIASVLDSSAGNGGLPVADDLTAITVLTVDDAIDFDGVGNSIGGDGIVSNGTPHEEAICNAFQELHGVPCGHTNVLAYPLGSRYFAIEASAIGGDPDAEVAFRVVGRATTNPDDPDVTCLNDPHPPHFVGMDGRLVEVIAPELPHFATPATWGEVHVSGAEIVAGASYEVRVYRMEGSTPVFSGVRSAVRARALGDTNGDSFVTIDDILCILAVFSGDLDCVAGHIEGADMAPCVPNGLINVDDIIAVLNGFQGGTLNCLPPC